MDVDDYENFELDVKNTLITNIFVLPGYIIFALYIHVFSIIMENNNNIEIGLMLAFIFAYSIIVMFKHFTYLVQIEYKPRVKND